MQIKKARNLFTRAMKSLGYQGKYYYCYCTKSSHFSYILEEVLRHEAHIETSSGFDIDLIRELYRKKKDRQEKRSSSAMDLNLKSYLAKIVDLINDGFENVVPICDNWKEIEYYEKTCGRSMQDRHSYSY